MAMTVCGGYTQNVKGVLVFVDQFFCLQSSRYKAELGVSFWIYPLSKLITDTVISISESKLTKLTEK